MARGFVVPVPRAQLKLPWRGILPLVFSQPPRRCRQARMDLCSVRCVTGSIYRGFAWSVPDFPSLPPIPAKNKRLVFMRIAVRGHQMCDNKRLLRENQKTKDLERFSSPRGVVEVVKGGLFLRKKPFSNRAFPCADWRTAIDPEWRTMRGPARAERTRRWGGSARNSNTQFHGSGLRGNSRQTGMAAEVVETNMDAFGLGGGGT
jgi:hypothetical protein